IFATGSSPQIPKDFQPFEKYLLTNESLFELKRLPRSVLIIGTGIIGLELGQALHRLGVKTTLLARHGSVGPLSDPKILKRAQKIFSKKLDLHFNCQPELMESTKKGLQVKFRGK